MVSTPGFIPFLLFTVAFPHRSILCLTQDLEGFIYCFLQPHPAFLATNLRLIFKAGVGSSNSHTSTACYLPASSDIDAGSCNFMCVMPIASSSNNLQALLCSIFSLGCPSGKLQGLYCWNSILLPALSIALLLLLCCGTLPVDTSALSLERFQLWHFSCWFFQGLGQLSAYFVTFLFCLLGTLGVISERSK